MFCSKSRSYATLRERLLFGGKNMAIETLRQLQPYHLDVLTEIGNIGSGNAATALASMMNTTVERMPPQSAFRSTSPAILPV